jgi:serine/threonine protein kinase
VFQQLVIHFNQGQFITKSSSSGKSCTYKPPSTGYNDKTFRSPEEYAHIEQTAATDVYALGSLIYYILTGQRAWEYDGKEERKKIQGLIAKGKKPRISSKLLKSTHPVDRALLTAYEMSTVYDPKKRATAKQVADFLDGVWKELGEA